MWSGIEPSENRGSPAVPGVHRAAKLRLPKFFQVAGAGKSRMELFSVSMGHCRPAGRQLRGESAAAANGKFACPH